MKWDRDRNGGTKITQPEDLEKNSFKTVAVVAMQGDYDKHMQAVERLGAKAMAARSAQHIEEADAVILPGGESTTIGKLLVRYGMDVALRQAATHGKPIFGTCAGLILLARDIGGGTAERGGQPTLGLLDITVVRNAFGRQVDSFEVFVDAPEISGDPIPAVFIRAPVVQDAGPDVRTLATYDGKTIFVRQGTILGSAFHPELTLDLSIHRYFLSMIVKDEL
ncbi:MAG: pyridoxal 5'-phosphate synthase glutaminase subunit PdxT [Capsulimonadaceae bacterium]